MWRSKPEAIADSVVRSGGKPFALQRRPSGSRPARRRAFLRAAWGLIAGITAIFAILVVLAFILAPDLASGIGFATLVLTGATLLLAVTKPPIAAASMTPPPASRTRGQLPGPA